MEEIVDIQVAAYNSGDIELFCSVFADEIQIFNYPDTIFIDGKEQLKAFFSNRFLATPNAHCKIVDRMILDNKIIDYEYVTGIFDNPIELIVLHTLFENKIIRVDYLAKSGYPTS